MADVGLLKSRELGFDKQIIHEISYLRHIR